MPGTSEKCHYGCNEPARYFNQKTERWTCAKSANSCPAVKTRKRLAMQEKYGVDNPSQLSETKEKIKQTSLQKYGTPHPSKSEVVQARRKQTSIEKYGVDNPGKNSEVVAKRKETNRKRYGGASPASSFDIQTKMKKTMLSRHGVENASQCPEITEKKIKTNQQKYGTDWGFQNEFVKKKIQYSSQEKHGVSWPSQSSQSKENKKKTMIDRYGVEFITQLPEFRDKIQISNKIRFFNNLLNRNNNLIEPLFSLEEYLGSAYQHDWKCKTCETTFTDYARHGVIPRCPTCFPINFNTSSGEKQITDFIKDTNLIVEENNRTQIQPYELDIWLPEKNIAIEYNGLYWHSDLHKSDDYHRMKWDLCQEKGIRLIQIFEDEWIQKSEIVKSRLLHILGLGKKICGARETIIRPISSIESKKFLEENHIQGNVNARIKLGAFFQEELVSVMTFGSKRKSMGSSAATDEYELLRFASKYQIPGIASKFFSFFRKQFIPKEVISYCDLRWGTGTVYEKMGFELDHITKPNYFYVIGNIRESRYKYRKDVLVNEGFDPSLTEREIMCTRGFIRIYDAGHKLFTWRKEKGEE